MKSFIDLLDEATTPVMHYIKAKEFVSACGLKQGEISNHTSNPVKVSGCKKCEKAAMPFFDKNFTRPYKTKLLGEELDECCKDGGECKCKKGEKCDSPSCKCKGRNKKKCACSDKDKKQVKESESKAYEEGYAVGYTKGGKRSDCPTDYTNDEKIQWKDGFKDGQYDRTTEYGKGIKEGKVGKGLCKQCGIKLSKLSKDEGFCVECATPINEGKYDNDDDYGDYKLNAKKDDALDKDKCPKCGSNKGYVKVNGNLKCISCGKQLKESKFDKYLEESAKPLLEGTMDADLRKKIIAAGIPVPSTVTVDHIKNIKIKLKDHPELLAKVSAKDAVIWTPVEEKNMTRF